jgi:hypothetical protein
MKLLAAAALIALLAARPAAALDGPESLVQALYAPDAMPDTAEEGRRFLSADNAQAYARQLRSKEVEPATGFDWRCDCQDGQMSELVIGKGQMSSAGGATLATVKVDFRLEGEPRSLTYELCLGRQGWRIADLRPSTGAWSLRDLLGLKGRGLRC